MAASSPPHILTEASVSMPGANHIQIESGTVEASECASRHAGGFAHTIGRRPTMEDEMILGEEIGNNLHVWAVLDGHGGRFSVERLIKAIPEALKARLAADGGEELSPEAITEAIEKVDQQLCEEARKVDCEDGATCTMIVTNGNQKLMCVAQIGDSQVVRCGAFGAEELCSQHRTDSEPELKRLESVGAEVVDDRVKGRRRSIAVTRALGDVDIKDSTKGLIATAEVTEELLSASDELLIIGCDGLWDVMGAEDAWELAKRKGRKGPKEWDVAKVARELVQAAYELNSGDNISVLVLALRPKRKLRATAGAAALHIGKPDAAAAAGKNKLKPADVSITVGANGQVQGVRLVDK